MQEGSYLYCIIRTDRARRFGPLGIGGRGDMVSTIDYGEISCVVSRCPLIRFILNRENMVTHQRVIERVMEEHTALPVRFSTIAESPEDVRRVLAKRHTEFACLLKNMEGKVELGLKATWKDMGVVFEEIVEGDGRIKRLRDGIAARPSGKTYFKRVRLGKLVEAALQRKKEAESEKILSCLGSIATDTRENRAHGDALVLNAAFLVHRDRMGEFDVRVKEIDETSGERFGLKYVGPAPPYNFVNIMIEWDEKEPSTTPDWIECYG